MALPATTPPGVARTTAAVPAVPVAVASSATALTITTSLAVAPFGATQLRCHYSHEHGCRSCRHSLSSRARLRCPCCGCCPQRRHHLHFSFEEKEEKQAWVLSPV